VGTAAPAAGPGGVVARSAKKARELDDERSLAMAQIVGERVSVGDAIVDYDDKVFEDIQAEPGEKAYILMHTVPFEGSVGLVNMLTCTRINRKGFDTHLVLYGPGSLMASATRGYPKVGDEAFPGALNYNRQLQTFMDEGGHVYACRFSAAALYGMREVDMIEGVKPINPLDVLDAVLTARRENALIMQTWNL
jgi:uncharacterized repeat protein (TIGR04044 family)